MLAVLSAASLSRIAYKLAGNTILGDVVLKRTGGVWNSLV